MVGKSAIVVMVSFDRNLIESEEDHRVLVPRKTSKRYGKVSPYREQTHVD